jgi:hypothetical protein
MEERRRLQIETMRKEMQEREELLKEEENRKKAVIDNIRRKEELRKQLQVDAYRKRLEEENRRAEENERRRQEKAEERKRALEDWYKNKQGGSNTRVRMRSTSRDGVGMSNGTGKYRRKKAAYSKFEEEFQNSLMIAAGNKGGRETLDPNTMHKPKIEVYNTVE